MQSPNDLKTDHYGFEVREINKLDDVTNDKSIHYVYDIQYTKVHFLYRPIQNSKGLLVAFHGARFPDPETGMPPLPLFRGYNYPEKMTNVSVLSICDPILYEYSANELRLSWYLDTVRFQITKPVTDIVERIRKLEGNDNIVFFGTSGGGFPAIKYAGIFNQKALLSNSQLMLDKYSYFNEFIKILAKNGDKIVESPNICRHLARDGFPQKIILYVNKSDTDHLEMHAEPLCNGLKENGKLNILDYHPFEGLQPPPGKTAHHVQWPSDYKDLMKKILDS
jgi:hypothetical protein